MQTVDDIRLETVGLPLGRRSFLLKRTQLCRLLFRSLGWDLSPTRDASFLTISRVVPCHVPSVKVSTHSYSLFCSHCQPSLGHPESCPFSSPRVRGRSVRFEFPWASTWVSLQGGVLRKRILEALLVNTAGGVRRPQTSWDFGRIACCWKAVLEPLGTLVTKGDPSYLLPTV